MFIHIDPSSGLPIYLQIAQQIKTAAVQSYRRKFKGEDGPQTFNFRALNFEAGFVNLSALPGHFQQNKEFRQRL